MPDRYYEFDSGYETDLTPTVSDPANDQDLVNLAYADGHYARGVADADALKAITTARRSNNLPVFVVSLKAWFIFNSASSATGDDIFVITPTAGTGRWLRVKTKNTFAMTNNQSAAADITGLSFDGTKVRSALFMISLFRNGSGTNKSVSGTVSVDFDGTNWNMSAGGFSNEVGLVLSINSSGQVQYTLDSNSGSSAETFRWKILELIEV